MSLELFRKALDELSEPAFVEGDCKLTERLAIALPDGDVSAADDKMFVDWLIEHSEPAPFGAGGKTKVDSKVRDALRLKARGKADISGFDPTTILDEIEKVLSAQTHLDAKLTDVLVYREGGHFKKHKDTPRGADLVGTLVVALPIEHTGGEFEIANGEEPHVVDWSGSPDSSKVRWVAMFSDADHEVQPVTSGARVTLVYSLTQSDRPREDKERAKRMEKIGKLAEKLPSKSPLMIACTRHVITDGSSALQEVDVLRGMDREIADLLIDAGHKVNVRSCITATESDSGFGTDLWSISRLSKPIPPKEFAKADDCVTFGDSADYDGEEMPALNLGKYILDAISTEQWVIRKNAATTLACEAEMFSEDGYFGNEGYEAHIYTLAALEVLPGKGKKTVAKKAAPAKTAKAPAKKAPAKKAPAKKAAAKRR